MKGNPTAGILLLVLASLLIVLGVTDKGKKIIAIILGKDSSIQGSGATDTPIDKGQLWDSAEGDPNYGNNLPGLASYKKTPGAFVGEKGAAKI
jgi:hypothetical protein